MSTNVFDATAPKKATNLSLNSDLLRQAKMYHINLSQTLENYLAELLCVEKQKQWLRDNKKAITNYNQRVKNQGVFSDGLRGF